MGKSFSCAALMLSSLLHHYFFQLEGFNGNNSSLPDSFKAAHLPNYMSCLRFPRLCHPIFLRHLPSIGQGPIENEIRKRNQESVMIQNLLDPLKKLKITGASAGGPYFGIAHNDVTRSIVEQGSRIIPALVQRLDSSEYDESAYIIFCLRELRAKSARDKILELEKSLDDRKRFAETPHDLTLKMQIKFFKRDYDTWK
jgi:hypothetical protein